MRILLLQTLQEDHVYSVSTRGLCAALQAHGEDAILYDYFERPGRLSDELVVGGYDAVISFGSFLGATALVDGPSVFDVIGAKFLGWHFDHPIYLTHHMANPVAGRRTLHPNASHVRFAVAARLDGAHGVMLPGADPHILPVKDFADRDIDVFIAATCNGEPQRHWEQLDDSPAKRLIAEVTDRLLNDREVSVIDAFYQACGVLGYGQLALSNDVIGLLRSSLNYVRHMDRIEAIRTLVSSGVSLTLCGSGWEAVLADASNLRLVPAASFVETRKFYGEAKISINLNAANGGCERAINAMLAGSCVVSDYSSTLADMFTPGELRFFDRHGLHGVAQVVGDLLESGQAEALAGRGAVKAGATMLWTHRVDAVLEVLG